MSGMMTEAEVGALQQQVDQLIAGLNNIVFGQEGLVRLVVTGLLGGGHVLLEGLPGLGKTELVKGLAALSGLEHQRVQFTPDLLPGDITGTQVLEESPDGLRQLVFRPGPVFAQILLADEINRASPKTQAALLEAMAERHVTVLGQTHALPKPFFVLATQNPVELDGTYPLPEAQVDRFAIKATVTGVDDGTLARILLERPGGQPPTPEAVTDAAGIQELMAGVRRIALPEAVAHYIARLVQSTRPELDSSPTLVRDNVRWGASPRAAIAMAASARANALLNGRPSVGFADVRDVAAAVLGHRLVLSYEAGIGGIDAPGIVRELVDSIEELAA